MPKNILLINASLRRADSITRDLTSRIVKKFPNAAIRVRDLVDELPFIDEAWVEAKSTPVEKLSGDQKQILAFSDSLISELQAADVLVFGLPIYNFSVPTSFRAWIDLVARAGVTFTYTENGPEGLLTGKQAIIAIASGGTKVGSDIDFSTDYIRHILGFIGITDVKFVSADTLMVDEAAALSQANDQLAALSA